MNISVFFYISEENYAPGYKGWLWHDSGALLGFGQPFPFGNFPRSPYPSDQIDWMNIYEQLQLHIHHFDMPNDVLVQNFKQELLNIARNLLQNHIQERYGKQQPDENYGESFSLYHPLASHSALDESLTLENAGFTDGDIAFLAVTYHARGRYHIVPAYNAEKIFDTFLASSENIITTDSKLVSGILLYTDEDKELSRFVREHFASLDRMSGKWCQIFVIEEPPIDWHKAKEYWHSILESKLYQTWSLVRWIANKPYDKTQAYEIGHRLGVFPEQLPCLVLINHSEFSNHLIFPIHSVSTSYFRHLFSALEHTINSIKTDQSCYELLAEQYDSILEKLHKTTIEPVPSYQSMQDIKRLIYNHSRAVQKLKEQQARFGPLNTPPHILLEIEEREAEVENLQIELDKIEAAAE